MIQSNQKGDKYDLIVTKIITTGLEKVGRKMTDSPSGREGDSEQGPEDLRSDSKKKSSGTGSLSSSVGPTSPDNLATLQIMAASGPSQTVGARTASERRARRCRIVEKLFSKSHAHAEPSWDMFWKNTMLV